MSLRLFFFYFFFLIDASRVNDELVAYLGIFNRSSFQSSSLVQNEEFENLRRILAEDICSIIDCEMQESLAFEIINR